MSSAPSTRPLCIVLAAGRGTRMGTPKALMMVAGRRWWKVQHERLTLAGVDALWVISPTVADSFAAESSAPWHTIVSWTDAPPPMFASVAHAFSICSPRARNFVLPVDVPCPSPKTFARLLAGCNTGACVPARGDETGHPLCLEGSWVFKHLCTPPLPDPKTARLDEMTRRFVRHIQVDDPDVCINLNTPHALEAWLASNQL